MFSCKLKKKDVLYNKSGEHEKQKKMYMHTKKGKNKNKSSKSNKSHRGTSIIYEKEKKKDCKYFLSSTIHSCQHQRSLRKEHSR